MWQVQTGYLYAIVGSWTVLAMLVVGVYGEEAFHDQEQVDASEGSKAMPHVVFPVAAFIRVLMVLAGHSLHPLKTAHSKLLRLLWDSAICYCHTFQESQQQLPNKWPKCTN